MTASPGFADLSPLARAREQRAWYWYDWANSAYVTTIATVLFAPYLTSVAEKAACGFVTDEDKGLKCTTDLHVLGVAVSPGSLVFYVVTLATIASALLLPVVGAAADRSARKKAIMAGFAWAGSVAAGLMFFVAGSDWQLGVVLLFAANICLGSSLVVYDAILCEIALPDERDRVSSRGWALGYLGGGLLLAVNLAVVTLHDSLGIGTAMAVRLSLLSAAVWWAAFTVIPYRGIRNRTPAAVEREPGGLVRQSFGQLAATLRDMRNYPVTLTFLLAYLFYNDGIQTVIASASVYGDKQLGFSTSVLIATILLVQFVAFFGALLFGRLAASRGSRRVILGGLVMWMVVVTVGYFIPEKNLPLFLALAVGIGLVLGGTQALSRSFFSQLIPRGREAEYFSLYQACERGTSWLGTLVFGLVHQWTDSYRPAIFALILFFVVGGGLLYRVDPRRGVAEAGNEAPQVL
ncbi:MFS transporter [Nocardioides ungokensis]|uniref:MFS transporter n=1 Tax=Nocardioides ungokensis TaxID=1643322 RepID=UPI0015DFFC70|nr:MFS transporter [Nocardioides ungokensis]